MLHNLQNFSLLRMLSIHIVGTAMYQGVHPPPSSDPDPTVKLAHLQNLRLVSAFLPEKILRFYASLVLPTTATVDLRFRGGSTNTRYQECGPLINTIQGIDNATLLLSRACGTVSVHSADGKLRLAWELGNTANNSIAFSAITFPALQRLTVSIPVDPTEPNDRRERRDLPDYNAEWEAEISALLHPIPAVTSLTIDCSLRNRYALFNIIGRKLNSTTPFVLPNLSSITISDFDNHTRSAMQLLFCARARAKDGIPLTSLEVRMAPGAVFPKDTLARLESAVGTVTVHQDDW
ncbi:hypothetical protein A0H81_08888 [Grifola frondosa]|uniref:Uncharacterized protein n=1 Tax=Grifola frondosa TaxID=5627 RepID=A0A1C7M3G3_GRIFR|nr:hypothetical protein A0H81_08888 [Grifola frondosa]